MEEIEELAAMLPAYGLSQLVEEFRAEKYTVKVLRLLDEADGFDVVTKHAWQKVLLRKLIADSVKDQRDTSFKGPCSSLSGASSAGSSSCSGSSSSSSAGPSSYSCSSSSAGPSYSDASSAGPSRGTGHSTPVQSSRVQSETSRSRKRATDSLPCSAAKVSKLDAKQKILDLDVSLLLEYDECGKLIKQQFERRMREYEEWTLAPDEGELVTAPVLSENQRQKIVEIIVRRLLEISPNPDHTLLPSICHKIVDIFSNECIETYYIAPKTESVLQYHPKGKLVNALRNVKSRNKLRAAFDSPASTPPCNQRQAQAPDSNRSHLQKFLKTPITDDINAAAKWLAHGRTPWPLALEKWELSAPLRFRCIFKEDQVFINNYLADWPILEHKSGHELILLDFKLLRCDAAPKLITHWDEFVEKTLNLAQRDVKDKEARSLVLKAKSLDGDRLGLALLQILPAIRPNHTYMVEKEKVKVRIDSVLDSYLLLVEKEADVKNALKLKRESLNSEEGGGQPLIIVVGNLEKISSIHVSIAKLRYRVSSIVEALDLYFKSFHVFHLKYPAECIHILIVLQRAIYEFTTPYDTSIQHSWIKVYQ